METRTCLPTMTALSRSTAAILDARLLGTDSASSILHVTNPWNTNVLTSVVLRGGELSGGTITNDGLIRTEAGDTLVSAR